MRLLDLYCGVGGATKGYQEVGFTVTGVDIRPQKHYCGDAFVLGDALAYLMAHGGEYDAIHASPPCQAYSKMRALPNGKDKDHPDLVAATRDLLVASGRPYVIENVPKSPVRGSLLLCGSMFGLKSDRGYLMRHRWFETSFLVMSPGPCRHEGVAVGVYGHGSAGHLGQRMRTANVDEARLLMAMPWAPRDGLAQAIPPPYTAWIGGFLRAFLA